MVDFDQSGTTSIVGLENIRAITPLPGTAVEANKGCVYSHITATFVDFVDIAGTGLGDERYPAGELPFHLYVEVRRLFEFVQEVGDAIAPG